MEYQRVLGNEIKTSEEVCNHGLSLVTCWFCSGNREAIKTKKVKEISSDILNKYEELKIKFRNYRDIWTKDELFVVYANFEGKIGTKFHKELVYKTAIELERTIGAINWAISHIFSEKEYHRGQIVKQFRLEMGIK